MNSWTREDAVENALKLTQRDGDKITRSGWVANNIRHQQLCGYCYADGLDSIYIEEGRALNPRFRELGPPAFQFEYDMLHVHNVSKPITPDRTDRPDFFNGLNSNVYMSVADIQEFTKQVGGRFPFEMVHVPRGPNWKDLQGTFWNNMMVVPVKGPNPEAGFEFASWYASEEGAIARIDLTGMPSSHLGLFRSPQWQVHKGISVQYGNFFEVLRGPETAGPYPYVRSAAFNSSTAAAGPGSQPRRPDAGRGHRPDIRRVDRIPRRRSGLSRDRESHATEIWSGAGFSPAPLQDRKRPRQPPLRIRFADLLIHGDPWLRDPRRGRHPLQRTLAPVQKSFDVTENGN